MNTTVHEAKEKIKDLILSYEHTKLIKETNNYLHFVFTTKGFHFKDDVEFYFDSKNSIIDFKSQSRIGYSAMGMNRERYEMIKEDYKEYINNQKYCKEKKKTRKREVTKKPRIENKFNIPILGN